MKKIMLFCLFNLKMNLKHILWLPLLLGSLHASADGWYFSSDKDKLKNKTILDVGNLSKLSIFNSDNKKDIYRVGMICFVFQDEFGLSSITESAAMILDDQFQNKEIALITSSYSSIKLDLKPIRFYDCHEDLNQTKENLDKRIEDFKRKMEEFKKQNNYK